VTRRTYSTEQERLDAERAALADAQRTGHYQAPVSAQEAEAYQRRYTPSLNVPHAGGAPTPKASPVTAEQVAQVVREATAGLPDPTGVNDDNAQGRVARQLQALGATSDQVMTAMRQVQRARTLEGGDGAAADRLQRLRGGPFQTGRVR
jgi:hypothetical protein